MLRFFSQERSCASYFLVLCGVLFGAAVGDAGASRELLDQAEVPYLLKKLEREGNWRQLANVKGAEPPSSPPPKPRIAFLFMVYDSIEFSEAWEGFFASANKKDYTVYVHAALPHNKVQLSEFFSRRLVDRVQTSWCHNTHAQFALLKQATLEDRHATHFAWLSGDSIPVKNLSTLVADLQQDPRSRFCLDPNCDRAEMWHVLQRRHAAALRANQERLFDFFASFKKACEDEDMFWAPLNAMGFGAELKSQCVMWTDWEKPLSALSKDSGSSRSTKKDSLLASNGFLESKVQWFGFRNAKAQWLEADWLLRMNPNSRHGGTPTTGTYASHPWTFRAVPAEGMQTLLADPDSWFARKFEKRGEHFGGGVYVQNGTYVGSIESFILPYIEDGVVPPVMPKLEAIGATAHTVQNKSSNENLTDAPSTPVVPGAAASELEKIVGVNSSNSADEAPEGKDTKHKHKKSHQKHKKKKHHSDKEAKWLSRTEIRNEIKAAKKSSAKPAGKQHHVRVSDGHR